MNKCLVTKLSGSSNNPELLRLGEMRIKVLKVQNPTDVTQGFSLGFNKPTTLKIVNGGYFTDKTLTENKGNTIALNTGSNNVWVNGTDDVEIAILDKYDLTSFYSVYSEEQYKVASNREFSISDLKYSTALTSLKFPSTQVSGNIGDLKALTSLQYLSLANTQINGNIDDLKTLTSLNTLYLFNTQVSGNVGALKTLTSLNILYLSDTQVSGNIGDLKTLTSLNTLYLPDTRVSGNIGDLKSLVSLQYLSLVDTNVSGNIGDLKTLTSLITLYLSNKQVPITGNISELSALSKCQDIYIGYSTLTGDLATLPAICRFASFIYDKGSVFSWSTRPSTAKIIAIEGSARISNIDKMLQDQAQCQVGFSSGDSSAYKTISVVGNRTAASDAAVATLQQKGYTVSIAKA